MLINVDVKGLEVVVAAELSGDEVLGREIVEKQDIHQNNQDAFGLPSRLVSKRFKFKLLYGATAFGYARDTDFTDLNKNEREWQEVIDAYYYKYSGIAKWHTKLIQEAKETGQLVIPSGRVYPIEPDNRKREPWPLTIIKNYPVNVAA